MDKGGACTSIEEEKRKNLLATQNHIIVVNYQNDCPVVFLNHHIQGASTTDRGKEFQLLITGSNSKKGSSRYTHLE